MRGSFTEEAVQEVEFITTIKKEGMRVIGLMESMMDMEWRHGPEGADIGGNIGKD